MIVYDEQSNEKWHRLFHDCKDSGPTICNEHWEGIELLNMPTSQLPGLETLNVQLRQVSNWEGFFSEGLIEYHPFYQAMSKRQFPVGNFLRDDLSFTPYPDYFHDVFGHLPMLTCTIFSTYCQEMGKLAIQYEHNPEIARLINRFSWFTTEVGVVRQNGNRAYGGALISSSKELTHMSTTPGVVKAFKFEDVVKSKIDDKTLQEVFYAVESFDHLMDEFLRFKSHITSKLILKNLAASSTDEVL
ncbi:hypothetical protein PRUB_a0806 [Pseudoalteromonas rubra]|uniref:Biopterin-dependent aromatic amino acid hydroxylase family profile domain-containing protein n=2 Tax=Pseudoalteromonas rubra TaxID=43658 RepID=A0A8T0C6N5_9GAMM|nr:hypothetical protein PRUB_a0806 [Pseudoalteromonas rubra]